MPFPSSTTACCRPPTRLADAHCSPFGLTFLQEGLSSLQTPRAFTATWSTHQPRQLLIEDQFLPLISQLALFNSQGAKHCFQLSILSCLPGQGASLWEAPGRSKGKSLDPPAVQFDSTRRVPLCTIQTESAVFLLAEQQIHVCSFSFKSLFANLRQHFQNHLFNVLHLPRTNTGKLNPATTMTSVRIQRWLGHSLLHLRATTLFSYYNTRSVQGQILSTPNHL